MRPFASNLTLPAFPVLSRLAHGPRERLTAGVRRLLRLLHLGGMPFAILIAVLADRIVTPVFGPRFAGASALLPWLAPVLFLLPPVSLYGYLAVALGRQRLYTIAVALALAVNTVLDLLLIPGHQAAGAAMATLAAEVVLYLAGILLLDETGGIKACLEHLWRPVVAGAAMAAVCWPLGDLPLPAVAAGAAFALVLYLALLLALGALTRAEVGAVLDRLRRRTGSG
jgi:O-antigen/teichoic acid export membrane protein